MVSCEVLVVGGGPAGSTCARALSKAGLDVVVLDKAQFPRDKVCGGWITPQILEELELEPRQYARGCVLQPITGFRVSSLGKPGIHIDFRRTVSFGVRRCEFDTFLLRRSGARVFEGTPVTSLDRTGEGWSVNDRFQARLLVGAGGHFCPVARLVGPPRHSEPVVAAQEFEIRLDGPQRSACRVEGSVPELYFCRDLRGYGWCFRKGDFLNIGLGRIGSQGLSEQVGTFVRSLKTLGRISAETAEQARGHAYLLYGYSPRPAVDERLLLIGDSAGLAYPQSGEGIRPAVESGLIAAQAIIRARGRYDRASLEAYSRRLKGWFGPESSPAAPTRLPTRLTEHLAGMALRWPWFLRHIVLGRFFLHGRKPAFSAASSQPIF